MGMSLAMLQEEGVWNATIELKIDFLRPVREGRLRAIGRGRDQAIADVQRGRRGGGVLLPARRGHWPCLKDRAVSDLKMTAPSWQWLGLEMVDSGDRFATVEMTTTEDMTNHSVSCTVE